MKKVKELTTKHLKRMKIKYTQENKELYTQLRSRFNLKDDKRRDFILYRLSEIEQELINRGIE